MELEVGLIVVLCTAIFFFPTRHFQVNRLKAMGTPFVNKYANKESTPTIKQTSNVGVNKRLVVGSNGRRHQVLP